MHHTVPSRKHSQHYTNIILTLYSTLYPHYTNIILTLVYSYSSCYALYCAFSFVFETLGKYNECLTYSHDSPKALIASSEWRSWYSHKILHLWLIPPSSRTSWAPRACSPTTLQKPPIFSSQSQLLALPPSSLSRWCLSPHVHSHHKEGRLKMLLLYLVFHGCVLGCPPPTPPPAVPCQISWSTPVPKAARTTAFHHSTPPPGLIDAH